MRSLARGALATRVGRRTLLLFVGCALLPTSILAVFAYSKVRDTLLAEALRALEESAKRNSTQIIERATWLSDRLRGGAPATPIQSGEDDEEGRPKFRYVARGSADGRFENLTPGTGAPHAALDGAARARVAAGGTAIVVETHGSPRIWFVGRDARGTDASLLWAEPDARFLWGFAADEALNPELCVVSVRLGVVLQCSAGASPDAALGALNQGASSAWLTASRSLFLRQAFAADDWRVVAMQTSGDALRAVRGFGSTFALVTGLSLLVVLFVSQVQIRRQTEPLDRLHQATKEVARGRFDVVVHADSGDEFETLAKAFTSMSSTLGRQFDVLYALDEVDRRALQASSPSSLISSAGELLLGMASTDRIVLAVPPAEGGGDGWNCFDLSRGGAAATFCRPVSRRVVGRWKATDAGHDGAQAVDLISTLGLEADASRRWIFYPLWHHEENQGVVGLRYREDNGPEASERRELRRFTDRLAIALASIRLVQQLDSLSLGTLKAFASAIDANSHWTAGHSERVTDAALLLADALGIVGTPRDILHRGSLLHDIGKIGVPAAILDKAGPLTSQERAIIQSHPVLGATILEPIGAFRDIIPIVRWHHERLDGAGYPDGLRGDDIPLLARILSVADVFDALVSERPYRAGMSVDAALSLIRADAGRAFDPHITAVFLALHDTGRLSQLTTSDSRAAALAASVGHGRQLLEVHA